MWLVWLAGVREAGWRLDVCFDPGRFASPVALFADLGSLARGVLSRVSLEPLAWGYGVRGFGSELRLALNHVLARMKKALVADSPKRFLFESSQRLA